MQSHIVGYLPFKETLGWVFLPTDFWDNYSPTSLVIKFHTEHVLGYRVKVFNCRVVLEGDCTNGHSHADFPWEPDRKLKRSPNRGQTTIFH